MTHHDSARQKSVHALIERHSALVNKRSSRLPLTLGFQLHCSRRNWLPNLLGNLMLCLSQQMIRLILARLLEQTNHWLCYEHEIRFRVGGHVLNW